MKRLHQLTLSVLCLSMAACSLASSGSNADEPITPKEQLRNLLNKVQAGGKTMFGHHDDTAYGHTWCGEPGRSDVLEVAGDYPAVMSWDLGAIELGDTANLDGVPFGFIRREVAAHHARGGVSTFSWHLWNPVTGANSWEVADTTVVSRMVNDPAGRAAFRAQLEKVGAFLNSLTDAEGNKIGVIFRPWHEHTGGWFFWGAPNCSKADYLSLWRTTREVIDSMGADNVLYAYSPDRVATEADYLDRYPGDDLVDILGADVYHFNGAEGVDTYRSTTANQLAIVRRLAAERGKVAAFTETGSESLPMENWWTDVLLPLIKENPVAYLVVWRNAHDKPGHFYAPFPGQPSSQSFKEFRNDTTILFNKDLQ